MKFDWTINLGNLIPIVTFLILIVNKMSRMETKVDAMWRSFTKDLMFSGRRNYLRDAGQR
jgi:hypothetical protein